MNARAAIILTVLYWTVAAAFATLTPRGGWIDLRWPIAIFFFAIPATFFLWLFAGAVRLFRVPMPPRRFATIGVALPFVYAAVVLGSGRWLDERRQHRLTEQWGAAALEALSDEPLPTAQGPLGVRLRYRVTYAKGLDLDEGHGAFAQVGLEHLSGVFFTLRRTVTPAVSTFFPAGSYEITEDFLPSFLPPSLVYPPSEPGANDRCFRWNPTVSRQYVLTADAQHLAIVIAMTGGSPLQRSTGRAYRLADFYETATREGGVTCDQNGR